MPVKMSQILGRDRQSLEPRRQRGAKLACGWCGRGGGGWGFESVGTSKLGIAVFFRRSAVQVNNVRITEKRNTALKTGHMHVTSIVLIASHHGWHHHGPRERCLAWGCPEGCPRESCYPVAEVG